jgi:hypothetical protein
MAKLPNHCLEWGLEVVHSPSWDDSQRDPRHLTANPDQELEVPPVRWMGPEHLPVQEEAQAEITLGS